VTIIDPQTQATEQRDVDPQLQYPLQKFPREKQPSRSKWSTLVVICIIYVVFEIHIMPPNARILLRRRNFSELDAS